MRKWKDNVQNSKKKASEFPATCEFLFLFLVISEIESIGNMKNNVIGRVPAYIVFFFSFHLNILKLRFLICGLNISSCLDFFSRSFKGQELVSVFCSSQMFSFILLFYYGGTYLQVSNQTYSLMDMLNLLAHIFIVCVFGRSNKC